MGRVITGRPVVPGAASGKLLVSQEPLSFWGGYDHRTGEIIDRRHPLSGQIAAGAVLALPGSRGSSTTSAVLLEAVRAGTAPAAIVTVGVDRFLTLAAIVAAEMFGASLPIVTIQPEELASLAGGASVTIELNGAIALSSGTSASD